MLQNAAASRNCKPIVEVLKNYIKVEDNFKVLEIASGTGQHVMSFAKNFPNCTFQPSEISHRYLHSIVAYLDMLRNAHSMISKKEINIRVPLYIDVSKLPSKWAMPQDYPPNGVDIMISINLLHICSMDAVLGLFRAAGAFLKHKTGKLFTYGPYSIDGIITPQSNVEFDKNLKSKNQEWGLRDIKDLDNIASNFGLKLIKTHAMPANNYILVFQKEKMKLENPYNPSYKTFLHKVVSLINQIYTILYIYFLGLYYAFEELLIDNSNDYTNNRERNNEMDDIKEWLEKFTKEKKKDGTSSVNGIALMTGGEGIIGREICKNLLKLNMKVISLVKFNENEKEKLYFCDNTSLTYINCDLSNLKSIKKACTTVKELVPSIDILICAAGVMCKKDERKFIDDGDRDQYYESFIENHCMINFISHAGIVNEMDCLLRNSFFPKAKVIFLSSATCHAGSMPSLKEINEGIFLTQYLNGYQAYANSKLFLSMYCLYLHNRYQLTLNEKSFNKEEVVIGDKCNGKEINKKSIEYLSLHPGVVAGDLYRHVNSLFQFAICHLLKVILRSPIVAGHYVTVLALQPTFVFNGRYFENNFPVNIKSLQCGNDEIIQQFGLKVDNILNDIGFDIS
uniref:Short chain dehydrogenase n=1 Tax=Parastrongyloides trichosuri TaxID=131310 RepID=A0A0N4ZGL1_PARTI